MTQAEQFDAAIKLAEFASLRHSGRREYEWKVTVGLWAVILTGIVSLRDQPLPEWVWYKTGFIYAFFWLRGIWVANEHDKQLSLHYRREAEQVLTQTDYKVSPAKVDVSGPQWLFGFLGDWSMIFQLAATIILLRVAYLVIQ